MEKHIMAILPDIKGRARKEPVCYDPNEDRFITIDDLDAGKAEIVPLDCLTEEQLKRLVIERNRFWKDYKVQMDWGMPAMTRDEVIKEIESDTKSGRMAVEADLMRVRDLLKQIENEL